MKKTLALTITAMLLVSTLAGIEFVRNACANPALMPEEPPSGYTINSDGTYVGENLRREGNLYTLIGDINCSIVIQRDGIVLDGAGYTLMGNGDSSGIWLQDKSDITIKNLNIKNFGFGIKFSPNYFSTETKVNCTLTGNNLTNNTYGMSLPSSSKCYVAGNYIADNTNGVSLQGSNNIFSSNKLERNQYDILDQGYGDNDLDTSNTIDGKPIYYWINKHDITVPSDAGLVVLKNCSGIKVENLSLEGNENGLLLLNTNDSTITENLLSNNINGIILIKSYNNLLSGNHIADNNYKGIILDQSSNNSVLNNKITENGGERERERERDLTVKVFTFLHQTIT